MHLILQLMLIPLKYIQRKHKVKRDIHSLSLLVFTESSHVSYQIKGNGA